MDGNITSQYDADLKNTTTNNTLHWARNIQLVFFFLLSTINLLVNFKVISLVSTMPRQKQNARNILVAQMSVLLVILNLSPGLSVIFTLDNTAFSCFGNAFLRYTVVSIIPLNLMALSYERLKIFRLNYRGEKFLVIRGILLQWTVAALGNLPSLLQVQFLNTTRKCTRIFILNSMLATIGYEVFKLVAFSVLPTGYIFYSLYQIRSKVSKYLFSTEEQKKEKVRKIRLIVFHGVLFPLLYIPAALLHAYHTIVRRVKSFEIEPDIELVTLILMVGVIVFGKLYSILNPIITLHLNEDMRHVKWYSFTYKKKVETIEGSASTTHVGKTSSEPDNKVPVPEIRITNAEDSEINTVPKISTVAAIVHEHHPQEFELNSYQTKDDEDLLWVDTSDEGETYF